MCHNSITGGHMNFILGSQHEDDPPTSEALNGCHSCGFSIVHAIFTSIFAIFLAVSHYVLCSAKNAGCRKPLISVLELKSLVLILEPLVLVNLPCPSLPITGDKVFTWLWIYSNICAPNNFVEVWVPTFSACCLLKFHKTQNANVSVQGGPKSRPLSRIIIKSY